MTFLHNHFINIATTKLKKIIHFGSLHTIGRNFLAVEFYSEPIINSINYSERPYLCTSSTKKQHFKGSITIEASISFPIFMIASYALISIISVLYLQLSMQIALEETIRSTSKSAYISSLFLNTDEDEQEKICHEEPSISENLTISFISSELFKNNFINNNNSLINSPFIKNGQNGISFLSSSIDLDAGIADIVVNYQVKLPFIPESFYHIDLNNRCFIHLYTGKDLSKKQSPSDSYVYYTSHGSVFHFNRYCQYLLDYTEAIDYHNVDPLIPSCKECVNQTKDDLNKNNPIVYITESKRCYHLSLNCPGFTGNIFRTHYSSLNESNKICEKCLEGK